MEEEDFRRRRNLWLAMTALAFLSSNFKVFMLIAAGLLLLFARKDRNPFAPTCSSCSSCRPSRRCQGWESPTSCSS